MKLKYFLRGFGTGILFATIILTISYTVRSSHLTDNSTQTAQEDTALEEDTQETASQAETQNETVTQPATQEVTTKEIQTPTGVLPDTTKKVTVTGGANSSTVAKQLQDAGVITNAKDFDTYLMNNGYSKKIRPGTYKFETEVTFEQIAEMITKN